MNLIISSREESRTQQKMESRQAKQLNVASLAFVGDAVFELLARAYVVGCEAKPSGVLHNQKVELVCAAKQAQFYDALVECLTGDELDILKRGRNSNSAGIPKHSSPSEYRKATGLECLFGYLSLSGQDERLWELFSVCVELSKEEKVEREGSKSG